MFIKFDRFSLPHPQWENSKTYSNLSLVFFVLIVRIKSCEFLITKLFVPSMVESQGARNNQ